MPFAPSRIKHSRLRGLAAGSLLPAGRPRPVPRPSSAPATAPAARGVSGAELVASRVSWCVRACHLAVGMPNIAFVGTQSGFQWALLPALRRVNRVRVTVTDDAVRAEVDGVGHRHPVTLPVTLALASQLVRQGAPLCVKTPGSTADGPLNAQSHVAPGRSSSD
jgi:hypothetical protein